MTKTNKPATIARNLPRAIAAIAALGLLGVTASGRAEQTGAVPAATVSLTQPDGPTFVPGQDPRFAQAFAAASTPVGPAILDGAATIAGIEPVEPESTPIGSGTASYYADRFNGQRTASGERFSNADFTAAHRTLPFGSRVRVTNPSNGASVVVRINDRGPFTRGRTIDLSRAAAQQVGIVRAGHGEVALELIEG